MMKIRAVVKLTSLEREKIVVTFIAAWKPFYEAEKKILTICGFSD